MNKKKLTRANIFKVPYGIKRCFSLCDTDPVTAFLRGEFLFYVSHGYLLIVFTQLFYRTTGNLWYNVLYFTSDSLFAFIIPFLMGAWVDRKGPKTLVFACSAGTSLVLLLCFTVSFSKTFTTAGMLGASLLISMLNAGMRVCVFTLIPRLASTSELFRMNGRQQTACQLGTLLGVLLAGLLFDRIGAGASFLLLALASAIATYYYKHAVRQIVFTSCNKATEQNFHFIRLMPALLRSPMLIALFIIGANDVIAINLFNLALPVLVTFNFSGHSFALAGLDSLFTAGAISFGWLVARVTIKWNQFHWLLIIMPMMLVAWMTQLVWFNNIACLFLTFLVGFTVSSYTVYFTTTMQAFVPAEIRGRFAALRRMVSTLIVAGSAYCFAVSYAKSGTYGVTMTTLLIEVLLLITCIVWLFFRRRSQDAIRPTCNNRTTIIDDHEDLKIMFDQFMKN